MNVSTSVKWSGGPLEAHVNSVYLHWFLQMMEADEIDKYIQEIEKEKEEEAEKKKTKK